MKIREIYNKYYLPESLQNHMLYVAGCANLIIDNWNGVKINEEEILRICLMHDVGNIVKIPEEYSKDLNFINLRLKAIKEYGYDSHRLNIEIGKIEGLSHKELEIIDNMSPRNNEYIYNSTSFSLKLCAYCDQRVSMNGVTNIIDRLLDAKERYKNKSMIWSNEGKVNLILEYAQKVEEQIFKYCTILPEDLNNKSIEKYVEKLKEFDIV